MLRCIMCVCLGRASLRASEQPAAASQARRQQISTNLYNTRSCQMVGSRVLC